MNKNIKLAVAGAVLALSASANAGIVIPAGDWTLDISGNVNTYAQWYKLDDGNTATIYSTHGLTVGAASSTNTAGTKMGFGNGLLPNFLSVGGSTRQNDLDVSFTISLQPGSAAWDALNGGTGGTGGMGTGNGGINNRQAFVTFGDKSWGSVKVGKDLGIFASDAILSDMTLLGVGAANGVAGNTSLGRIGYGYIYADWKPQIAYTTPNMSGFQATAGISQAFNAYSSVGGSASATQSISNASKNNAAPAYEGKASYSFAAGDASGKIWVSGIAQRIASFGATNNADSVAYAGDIGANVNIAGFGLTGYYYGGQGIGIMGQMIDGYGYSTNATTQLAARDSDGGYVQATYVLPTKTKIGASWGVSNLDRANGETSLTNSADKRDVGKLVKQNELWTVGVYHPLTKHLNLVAEYNHTESENQLGQTNKADSGNLGAILFF